MADPPLMIVFCSHCSLRLDEDPDAEPFTAPPCPECGSTNRSIREDGPNAARMTIRTTVLRKPGQRKTPIETLHGDTLSADGRWMVIHRIIDRRNDHYYERVHDHETREVVREVSEPLTAHQGHGSAKTKRSSGAG